MGFSINKIHEHFVGVIDGLDLKQTLSNSDVLQLNNALDEFGVLVFRNQILTNEQQIEFSNCLLYTSPSPRDATLSRMPSSA